MNEYVHITDKTSVT